MPIPSSDDQIRNDERAGATSFVESHNVARSAGVVSLAVFGSRLLGLVREQVMAALFGAGFITDAFTLSFRIPNILRDLFAEGVLSVAFVKTFTDYLLHEGEAEAWRLTNLVLSTLAIIVSALVLIGVIFAPQLVSVMAHGFSPEKTQLTITLTRIMFPFLLLVTLASVAMGILNAKGRFGIPASASTLFNVGSILGGLFFAYLLSGGSWSISPSRDLIPEAAAQRAIIGMAIGTLIGGVMQFLIQVPSLVKVGFRFRPLVSFTDPGVRQVIKLMAPAIIGTASVQINVLVNTFFASQINAGVSWLNFAFRLMQFPIGLFGVAIGTATLPAISRYASGGDLDKFRTTLAESICLVFFLTIPSACGLIVLGRPIIALIYQHGHFTSFDTEMVAATLTAYSIGLVGYAALKVLSPAFYALNDARTPMIVSLTSIGLNIIASYFLFHLFSHWTENNSDNYGHVGLALSTSIVALLNFGVLMFFMRRRLRNLHGSRIFSSFWRIMIAAIALSLVSFFSAKAVAATFKTQTFMAHLVETFIPILLGSGVFLLMSHLLQIPELKVMVFILRDLGRKSIEVEKQSEIL